MEELELTVTCKYCGANQVHTENAEDMDDVIKYDYEYLCVQCGSSVRINEALETDTLQQFGFI